MEVKIKENCLIRFKELFGNEGDIRAYFAPGRVNLIGEHTDYNGGHVFPCALTIGTYLIARKRDDDVIRFYSENFSEIGVVETEIPNEAGKVNIRIAGDTDEGEKDASWVNYPAGMFWTFNEKGYKADTGFDLYFYGNIPNGSGLSSSASIEVVTGVMLRDMFGFVMDNVEIAKLAQFSENTFNGVNCGIMDQFAVAMGKEDCAIYLDTSNLTYTYAPIKLEGYKIVIACSNKKRGLADSKYNERRSECEEALKILQEKLKINSLGDMTANAFKSYENEIKDETLRRRARHAVTENVRTKMAVEALEQGNLLMFGRLMNASHASLRDDYEVTGKELDTLVSAAGKCQGVIGSRMTGAGFGGCTVSIVSDEAVDDFIKKVGAIYENKIGYKADFYVVSVGSGACRI